MCPCGRVDLAFAVAWMRLVAHVHACTHGSETARTVGVNATGAKERTKERASTRSRYSLDSRAAMHDGLESRSGGPMVTRKGRSFACGRVQSRDRRAPRCGCHGAHAHGWAREAGIWA